MIQPMQKVVEVDIVENLAVMLDLVEVAVVEAAVNQPPGQEEVVQLDGNQATLGVLVFTV